MATAAMHDLSGNVTGSGVIDLNQNMGIGDYAAPLNLQPFYKKYSKIKSHRDFFLKIGISHDAMRQGIQAQDKQLAEQAQHLQSQLAVASKEPDRYDFKKDKNGEDVKFYLPRREVEIQRRIDEMQAQREESRLNAKSFPPNRIEFFDGGAAQMQNANLVELEMGDFDNGKDFDENNAALGGLLRAERDAISANLTNEESDGLVDRDIAAIRARADDELIPMLASMVGGAIYEDGKSRPGNLSHLYLPQKQIFVEGDSTGIAYVEDAFGMLVWLDEKNEIAAKIKKRLHAFNLGKPQLSLADKNELLRTNAAKVLLARRHLEFNCRALEAQGRKITRPKGTPWNVLAWCERATMPKLIPSQLGSKSNPEIDADEFEGE